MRRGCITLGNLWAVGLFAAAASVAHADSIYLNATGRKNLETIRRQIAPAPVFEDAARRMPYIRCVIVGERAARAPTARHDTPEGRPEYDFVAFDASGDQRSVTTTINATWINHIDHDYDSELDVRALFSNRDQLAGIALASRTYFALARRAGDPQGKLGLWRDDVQLPPEPAGVNEGIVIRFMLDPPVFDESGRADKWSERKHAEAMEATKLILARRLPSAHLTHLDGRPSLMTPKLIDAVARERAYRLSRAGFDRTALSMLVFMLDLATVRHRDVPAGDQPADMIYFEGIRSVNHAVEAIEGAMPAAPGHAHPPELTALFFRHRAARTAAEKQQLGQEYDALQEQLAPAGRTTCLYHRQFCIDSSQQAAVAIEALALSEGVYAKGTMSRRLTEALVSLHVVPDGPSPHKHDRIDLRDAGFKLLVQLASPLASPDLDRQSTREAFAREVRIRLRTIVAGVHPPAPEQAIALRALAAAGWGDAEELNQLTAALLAQSLSFAEDVVRGGEGTEFRRELSRACILSLRTLAELAGSQVGHERATAALILDRIGQMRETQRNREKAQRRYAVYLELWDAASPSP